MRYEGSWNSAITLEIQRFGFNEADPRPLDEVIAAAEVQGDLGPDGLERMGGTVLKIGQLIRIDKNAADFIDRFRHTNSSYMNQEPGQLFLSLRAKFGQGKEFVILLSSRCAVAAES